MPETNPEKPAFGFDKAENSPGFLLWQVTNMWQRQLRAVLAPLELTHGQYVVLATAWYLGQCKENITQADVAQQARMDKMMASTLIRKLEEKGWLTRKEHPTDTRAKILCLTESGQAVLKQAIPLVEGADARFFSPVMDKGILQVLQQLARE